MAVSKVPGNSVLKMQFQTGVDGTGKPVYRNKSLNNIKAGAADQDVFDTAQTMAGLQEYTLTAVNRADNSELVNQ
ncbi:protein of unknown function DUF1659 [Desulfofarcimen acetoxidans DSM 771]|uniref:DUF1659 domain-containing protein n=1 Tax=Desulfofarcimen acetoxidans (strain ATCC 49208 / DSM 771 / KCTC 5769 / VKM B-1644 / 5575) TaxID=485916 RepID=C8VY68_DESAS|nr:DUF1659 domain-containing protein [Desulfofarcimen acetoxidans]ACV64697.1 protein of unknown function DUF1659 [Desulfofarcimen acetoxidans DSM 771]